MRRACAIIKATALELLSEPLVFLVMISAMTLSVVAPAVHYHDFGEPSRMARDAGVSAIMVGGLVIVAFGTIKTIRRELESQTAMSALALSVSRRLFFLSKLLGVLVAYLFYVITVGAVSLAAVRGAIIGSEIAAQNHTMVRMYGPVYVLSIAAFVLPFLYGAIVNRYFHRRFTLNANLCAFVLALVAATFRFDLDLFLRLLPMYVLVACPALVLMSASASFSTRFRFNAAASFAIVVFAFFIPALGNYCVTDVLSSGADVSWLYFFGAIAAVLPPVAALSYLGVILFEKAE